MLINASNTAYKSKGIYFTLEADLKSKGVGVKSGNYKGVIQDLLVKVFAV